MTKTEERSDDQILEAAMCAWEEIDRQTQRDYPELSGIWSQMKRVRDKMGAPNMRYYTGQIAEQVSLAYDIAEKAADGYYDEPFDWEFVPEFLAKALRVHDSLTSFELCQCWRDCAELMGLSLNNESAETPTIDPAFDERELGTILAGLRGHQRNIEDLQRQSEFYGIASNEGAFDPLNVAEIDSLCEKINTTSGMGAIS